MMGEHQSVVDGPKVSGVTKVDPQNIFDSYLLVSWRCHAAAHRADPTRKLLGLSHLLYSVITTVMSCDELQCQCVWRQRSQQSEEDSNLSTTPQLPAWCFSRDSVPTMNYTN
jgi:hypothetical protein